MKLGTEIKANTKRKRTERERERERERENLKKLHMKKDNLGAVPLSSSLSVNDIEPNRNEILILSSVYMTS